MIVGVKLYNQINCVYYVDTSIEGCCAKKFFSGSCRIKQDEFFRPCHLGANYCKFKEKENTNVHLEELSNSNGKRSNSD